MTKREAMAQISADDLKLVAQYAAERAAGKATGPEGRRVRKAAKVLAQVQSKVKKEE